MLDAGKSQRLALSKPEMPFGQPRAELVAIAMLRTPDDTFANSTVYHRVAFTQNHDRLRGSIPIYWTFLGHYTRIDHITL